MAFYKVRSVKCSKGETGLPRVVLSPMTIASTRRGKTLVKEGSSQWGTHSSLMKFLVKRRVTQSHQDMNHSWEIEKISDSEQSPV